MTDDLSNVKIPVWVGEQQVTGLWLSARLYSSEDSKQRMLAGWKAGSNAFRFEQGDLLRFPRPQTLRCENQSGLALCEVSGIPYVSAPLTATEISSFRAYDVLVVQGAQVEALHVSDGALLDLSQAIDIGDYALHDTFDCSQSIKPLNPGRMAGKDIRKLLGDAIPAPSADRDVFLNELAAAGEKKVAPGGGLSGSRIKSVAKDFLGRFAATVLGLVSGSIQANGTGRATGNSTSRSPSISDRFTPKMPQAWRDALAKLAIASRVSRLIGWKQGAYLRKMLKMFDEGNIEEALRHALPIDSLGQSLGQAFSSPGRRQDLQLSGSLGPSANIGLDEELQRHLRELYRQSFERLDRQGKIDEAVFILADLLNARTEALDYLERHNRIGQAAELALAWDMPATTIIRLLLLSGDWDRAVQVARRDKEFSTVIDTLQASHPDIAVKLRLAWADYLADSGEWLAAVEAVWPISQARHLAKEWLLTAERAGEELSARTLVKRAALLPDTIEQYTDRILALANADTSTHTRTAVAEALLEVKASNAATGLITTTILPSIAADRAEGLNDLSKNKLNKLASLSNDTFLKADLPNWDIPAISTTTNFWSQLPPQVLHAPSKGLQPIHDVVALTEHRYLVALGEAGCIIVDRTGKILQRYNVPTYSLVISDSQRVALTVAPRETFSRISRLDLVNHIVSDIGTLRITFYANCFDGAGWTVVSDNRIMVLDTAKSLHNVLWSVGDLPGQIINARFQEREQHFLIRNATGIEFWNYLQPSRRLTERASVILDSELPVLLFPHGNTLQPQVEFLKDTVRIKYRWLQQQKYLDIAIVGRAPPTQIFFRAVHHGIMVGLYFGNSTHYHIYRSADGALTASFEWPGSDPAEVREQNNRALFFDKHGRILDILYVPSIVVGITLS
jgi:MoxR-vWA-beta-propeller ternary system domain bpX6